MSIRVYETRSGHSHLSKSKFTVQLCSFLTSNDLRAGVSSPTGAAGMTTAPPTLVVPSRNQFAVVSPFGTAAGE